MSTLRVDPLGISAVERLIDLANKIGNDEVKRWAELRLVELQREEARQLHQA
jgi:hypothetical protein